MRKHPSACLALLGIACLALGTTAWAQGSGFICYDCTRQCGIYTCYPGNAKCDNGKYGSYFTNDASFLGGCISGSGNCTGSDYTCVNTAYQRAGCSTAYCTWTAVVPKVCTGC